LIVALSAHSGGGLPTTSEDLHVGATLIFIDGRSTGQPITELARLVSCLIGGASEAQGQPTTTATSPEIAQNSVDSSHDSQS